MDQQLFTQLVAPIPGDHPCGQDIAFSPELDEVREARRQDDPSLTQGEWETELKVAQWPKVKELCEDILQNKSKDLQIACWYTEAMTKLHGFKGLAFGLELLEVLVNDFWEFIYPELDPDDLEERIGKIDWLNKQLPITVRNIPLTDRSSGAYSWLKWDESRIVENLGLKNPEARELAVADGKLSGDAFDRAVSASGLAFYEQLHADIQAARLQLTALEKHIDERFGEESPGLADLHAAVKGCEEVVAKIVFRLGGVVSAEDKQLTLAPGNDAENFSPAAGGQTAIVGAIKTRADAIKALRQVSQFFRKNEPHSPVALLAERAAKWAEMPLEHWLASVIKDDSTLGQLRELLDIQREG